MYVPSPSPEYVLGDEHGEKPDEFRLQKKVEPPSLLANVKLAEVLLLWAGGVEPSAVCGGFASTTHEYTVSSPVRSPETARTAKV